MAADAPAGKPGWQRFLEASGGAALVTVVLGGVLGQWLTCTAQTRIKERESALIDQRELVAGRLTIVRQSLELVGATLAAADDLVTITAPGWDPAQFAEGPAREATLATKQAIREAYNAADETWRRQRVAHGFLLAYYHGGRPEAVAAWRGVEEAVTAFVDCARRWHEAHAAAPTPSEAACGAERGAVEERLERMVSSLAAPPGGAAQR